MSKSKLKTKRIITNRDFLVEGDYECIEIDEAGIFWWKAVEIECFYKDKEEIKIRDGTEAAFPVTLEFVKDFFIKCGREFDPTKLPENYVEDPYSIYK